MKVLRSHPALRRLRASWSSQKIGFVPTMGYLHEGHLSLVRRARSENDRVLVSLFVNPLQFGPREDLKSYPRDEARDLALLKKSGCHAVYIPSAKDMYPPNFQTKVSVGRLTSTLCGVSRPAHFAGVATVVTKLLVRTRPDQLYLGQKDYQQVKVIERLVLDLDLPVQVRMCPIVRESDGLAMSSRNVRLTSVQRQEAIKIYLALKMLEEAVRKGQRSVPRLKGLLIGALRRARGARVDYAEIVDAATLGPVLQLNPKSAYLAAVAVFFGKTRLIDNVIIRGAR